jgi:uncharacterized membrane protein YeaQ/YmgE (transglycosylase-associated protein family)
MSIIALVVMGLVAGALASVVMRRSRVGIARYVMFGVIGAFVGGWLFGELGWHAPFPGIAGVCAIAFVGAAGVLLVLSFLIGTRQPR